ncbi:MAG: PstS family phosphate ABC transporter substrate-binding protein [Waterburya sp.]
MVKKDQANSRFKSNLTKNQSRQTQSGKKEKGAIELALHSQTHNILNYIYANKKSILKSPQLHQLKKELKNPVNIMFVIFGVFGLVLWGSLFFKTPTEQVKEPKETTIQGIVNYNGSPVAAVWASAGINMGVETAHPGLKLRYTKPLDGDYSTENAVRGLINGELSYILSDRPLTDEEFKAANLRSIALEQNPIAIDGIVIYTNNQTPVPDLNREQVKQIFNGKLKNWHQIDPKIKNLPIIPVLVRNEQVPGIEAARTQKTQYVDNYTLALREVIATPGAISFASASLVQNQRLLRMIALAEGNTKNYIEPWKEGKLNLKDFASGNYPLTRRIFLYYKKSGSKNLDQQAAGAVVEYLRSANGKNMLRKAGLVSIY